MTDIGLIFDASAVAAFLAGSIHVGEPLAEAADDGRSAGIPLASLVEAAAGVTDEAKLNLIADHTSVIVLRDDPESWRMLAATRTLVDRYEAASAALRALTLGVPLLSAHPDRYAALGDDLVIPIGE